MPKIPKPAIVLGAMLAASPVALAGDSIVGDASLTKHLRLWPAYLVFAFAVALGIYRLSQFVLKPKSKPQMFPKLTLRRRLYAPHSGGNFASVSFRPNRDA